MKINHNLSAMTANNHLLKNENMLAASVERLSSGLKLNSSGDDAAGMAIATKMKAQIRGLDRASKNSSDGISVIETVDGALQEVSSILQRMRELSVQAASDTNGIEDKQAIQDEILVLTEEVDRISSDTEFNTKKLLNGDLDRRVYTDVRSIHTIDTSDSVVKGEYAFTVDKDARQAVLVADAISGGAGSTVPAGAGGQVSINGVTVDIEDGESLASVYEKLRLAGEEGEVNIFPIGAADLDNVGGEIEDAGYMPCDISTANNLVFVSDRYGSSTEMKITCDNPALSTYLGIPESSVVKGTDAEINLNLAPPVGFSTKATVYCDGNQATITDSNGFKMTFVVDQGTAGTRFDDINTGDVNPAAPNTVLESAVMTASQANVRFDVTDIGTMTLQIGANQNQTVDVRIPSTSSKNLYIDDVDVTTVTGADRAIASYDKGIALLSETRSRIGAYQNRLDHAVASLDTTEENMTSALARIEDVDMAEEMTKYTQYNVLSQATTSVLTQANDLPQQVLQMLQ